MTGQNAEGALVPPFASIYAQVPVAAAGLPQLQSRDCGRFRACARGCVSGLARHRFFRDAPALAAIAVNVEADELVMRCNGGKAHARAATRTVRRIDNTLLIACCEPQSRLHENGCPVRCLPRNHGAWSHFSGSCSGTHDATTGLETLPLCACYNDKWRDRYAGVCVDAQTLGCWSRFG